MKQFWIYCVVGSTGVSLDYFIYISVMNIGFSYQLANLFGYLFGTVYSFFLNKYLTFRILDKPAKRMAMFLFIGAIGMTLSSVQLWLFSEMMYIDHAIAKTLTLPLILFVQFTLNRKYTFRS